MEYIKSEFDKQILIAEKEAEAFLSKIKDYKKCDAYCENNSGYTFYYSKDRATVKRASMDLSNSLITLRKSSVYKTIGEQING